MLCIHAPRRLLAAALLALALLAFAFPAGRSAPDGSAQISFIDVGQGDAALLQDSLGTDILIDGGPSAAGPGVVAYLRSHTDHAIDVILVTHADADHAGGLVSVLQASDLSVGALYYNGYPGSTQTWANLASQAAARGLALQPAHFPAEYAWGEFDVYILNPAPGLANPEQNDASVVARIDFHSSRLLFPGDIGAQVEAAVIARQTPVAADVLKVAHHGSATSSSAAFLAAVQPDYAVISVGKNSYGHPAPATLTRLADAGAQIWRTDQAGTILVTSDGLSLRFPNQPGFWLFMPSLAASASLP